MVNYCSGMLVLVGWGGFGVKWGSHESGVYWAFPFLSYNICYCKQGSVVMVIS